MKRLSCLLVVGFGLMTWAHADIVYLKDGRKFDGEVVENSDTKVVVKTKFGLTEFSKGEVDRVEKKETPEQEFKTRRAAVADGDVDGLFDLYLWAKGAGLKSKSKSVLRAIVKVDPDHENARKLLGYVRFGDRWVSEKEFARLEKEAERKAKEAQGFVEYRGEWMTPEEKEVKEHEARGEILIDGVWVNKRMADRARELAEQRKIAEEKRAQGLYEVEGEWVSKEEAEAHYANLEHPYRVFGDSCELLTNKGIEFGDKMIVSADSAYRKANQFFGAAPDLGGALMPVVVVSNLEEYNQYGNSLGGDEKSSSFASFVTPWLPEGNDSGFDIVTVTQYYNTDQNTELYMMHGCVEQFVRRMIGAESSDAPPRWFIDGVASYIERWQNPSYFGWSRDRLRQVGWLLKQKTLFGSYPVTEQSILQAGALVCWLKSPEAPEDVRTAFNEAIVAFNEGKKVQKAFRKLEKAVVKNEDSFASFMDS